MANLKTEVKNLKTNMINRLGIMQAQAESVLFKYFRKVTFSE
jgi:hypothetical protein